MKIRTLQLWIAALWIALPAARGASTIIVRADFQNLSGPESVNRANPGVMTFQGSSAPLTDNQAVLTESSFGQPFSPYVPRTGVNGLPTYAAEIAANVRAALYPPRNATRAAILSGQAAFRYKWLLFSPAPGETDVTSHFQGMGQWFGDAERARADQQIAILREALAVSPLDTELRDLLLDCYYDLAVAEMQFAKQDLASLAATHLGLTLVSPFVIDDEIKTYETLIDREARVLNKYGELLSMTVEGVEPSDFDSRELPGKPMGLYTFLRQQPYRNAVATEYATDTGSTNLIPDYDAVTKTATPRKPENLVLFAGYKDFATVLQIMGQYIQHNAELGRLRGMRQGRDDLTKARNAFSQILGQTVNDFHLLLSVVPQSFPPGDASGIRGAITGIQTSLADIVNVRAFINGTANLLGLDSDFLLLVQGANLPNGYNNESFDVLYGLLKGANQPLGDALQKMAMATIAYTSFRGSVDRVVQDLDDVDDTYAQRFVQITGYDIDEIPGFQGDPKPNIASELLTTEQNLASLNIRNQTLANLRGRLQNDLEQAQTSVTLAEGLDSIVDASKTSYINDTRGLYDDIILWSWISAESQAIAEGAYAIAGAELPGIPLATGAAIANEVIQNQAAYYKATRERDIDYASVTFESKLQKADNRLTINQALQQVGQVQREVYSNDLEITDNTLAISQAQAQRAALLAELRRISNIRANDSSTIRKSYYADPIHYVHSENALILTDSAFRNAQRWIFYTQRALEYKWQQPFSRAETSAQGVRTFDSGTIFKLRNAAELDDLLTQLKAWNDDRLIQDSGRDHTTFISLRDHVLAPNPNALNLTPQLQADPGHRMDLETGDTVSHVELFRRKLARYDDGLGNIIIPINTVNLAEINGNFFVGPHYTATTVIPGEWRDKIVYIKVNIVAEDGTSTPQFKSGALGYGGQMFFRTRIPPCPDRTPTTSTNDLPGEFFTAPFRYYTSANYNNLFSYRSFQNEFITMAYTGSTAVTPTGEEILASNFQINAFNQRSVATTELTLTLLAGQVDIQKIKDIEIIVRHHSSSRLAPDCPQ